MPAGIALGRPDRRRGGSDGKSAGDGQRAGPHSANDRARTGAQDVGNPLTQRPPDSDHVGFGRAFRRRSPTTNRLERVAHQSAGFPRADETAKTVCQANGVGTMKIDFWGRLAKAGRRAPDPLPEEMTCGFQSRGDAEWRLPGGREGRWRWATLLRWGQVGA